MSTVTTAPLAARSGPSDPLEKFPGYWKCGSQTIQIGVSDENLAYAFYRFRVEKILDLLCYESPISLYGFLEIFMRPETHALGAFWENPETGQMEMQGLGFVRDIRTMGNTAYRNSDVGEAFFRGVTERTSPTRYAQMMVEYAFSGLGVSVVSGITPVCNRAACLFPRKLGFTTVGPLPGGTVWHGHLTDVMLSSMTVDQWPAHSPWALTAQGAI